MQQNTYLVGLAGGSASGKTSFIRALSELFTPAELVVLSQDNYYKPLSKQQRDEQGEVNFDLPTAIDYKRLKADINKLQKGKKVNMVEYTFNNPELFPSSITLLPAPIVLVEGLFVYADPSLKRMFNWRLYIHTDLEFAKMRRLSRDVEERGMKEDIVHYQWDKHVLPAYKLHLEPHRDDAHLHIDNNRHFNNHLEQVASYLKNVLEQARG